MSEEHCEASRDGKHRMRVAGNVELNITYYECRLCGHQRDMGDLPIDADWWNCGHHNAVDCKSTTADAPEAVCPDCGGEWRQGVWIRPETNTETFQLRKH